MSTLFCLFQLPKVIAKEICKVRQQLFQEHCFFCWFPMALAPSDLGRLYCYSYAGLKIDTSLATNQINYYPCLYNVFHIQILAPICGVCTISKFLPLSVDCALYPNSCPCLWSVHYIHWYRQLFCQFQHADNGAALLLRSLKYGASIKQSEQDLET